MTASPVFVAVADAILAVAHVWRFRDKLSIVEQAVARRCAVSRADTWFRCALRHVRRILVPHDRVGGKASGADGRRKPSSARVHRIFIVSWMPLLSII